MAKRLTSVGRTKASHSRKTKKRLEIKRIMLKERANNKKKK